ncbi:TetR/AcrR family transcriptional regulator [Yinghuangia seranimata]|uniref:TetR/AcrR family transcriptional regulator n=1 Tax=Yinghuangia seranimata TaxID=408067 RepID=UPI00248B386B|nr:TetR/AcrR family transcriptional regulator [Yinghuangia seranimata]MDI2131499.1 helix-turn-helix domain-containing protein [Yinghuangia seranimata]
MPDKINGPQSASSTPLSIGAAPPRRERADAVRNRRRILDAAAALFAEHGVEQVSMDAIAAAAGVGKGTLFRRFGDRSGLAVALLHERETELQEAILSGPPPLGPGTADDPAEPAARAAAFTRAYLEYALANLELVRASETASPGARYRIGAYRFWARHLTVLLTEAGHAEPAAGVLAEALLAPLAAEHVAALRDAGHEPAEIADALAWQAATVAASARG